MKDRIYEPCKVGFMRWEVRWRYTDNSVDPNNGARTWRAVFGVRIYRFYTALRLAGDLQQAYNDGFHEGVRDYWDGGVWDDDYDDDSWEHEHG